MKGKGERRPPPNTPARGDRVKMRGSDRSGLLMSVQPERNWCLVEWDGQGPKICHLYELEKAKDA